MDYINRLLLKPTRDTKVQQLNAVIGMKDILT